MSESDTSRETVEAPKILSTLLAERDALQAKLDAAYTAGFEAAREMASKIMDDRAASCRRYVGMNPEGQCEGGAEDIRAMDCPQQKESSDE